MFGTAVVSLGVAGEVSLLASWVGTTVPNNVGGSCARRPHGTPRHGFLVTPRLVRPPSSGHVTRLCPFCPQAVHGIATAAMARPRRETASQGERRNRQMTVQ